MTDNADLSERAARGSEEVLTPDARAATRVADAAPKRKHKRRRAAAEASPRVNLTPTPLAAAEQPVSPPPARRSRAPKTAASGARIIARKGQPDIIVLPALATGAKPSRRSRRRTVADDHGNSRADTAVAAVPARDTAADFLPEYRSSTNGLRELLSSIRPLEPDFDHPYPVSPLPSSEDSMHIPHNRPGIPGSPDLPVGPVRWFRALGNAALGVFLLAFAGLVYSHLVSPTGINWQALAEKAGTIAHTTYAAATGRVQPTGPAAVPLAGVAATVPEDAAINVPPRISTTSARADARVPAEPRVTEQKIAEINMSEEELERQIRALEQSMPELAPAPAPVKRLEAAAVRPRTRTDGESLFAASIDPQMEQQIFARASDYLRQRDIASARMILNYAASMGSGISAMALAETYDPAYLQRISLQGVDADLPEARKWYKTASGLGVKEADGRLAALE